MNKKTLEILACPYCWGGLRLEANSTEEDKIIDGLLICDKCKATFDIRDGIPSLIPKSSQ